GDRRAATVEGAAMGPAVDAAREAGHDDDAGVRQASAERARDMRAVVAAAARADNRHRALRKQLGRRVAAQKEPRRRIVDRSEQRRKGGIGAREPAEPGASELGPERVLVEADFEDR